MQFSTQLSLVDQADRKIVNTSLGVKMKRSKASEITILGKKEEKKCPFRVFLIFYQI